MNIEYGRIKLRNFYTSKEHFTDETVRLVGEEYHHATRSCRVKTGELIGVTNGCGRRVHARIDTIDSYSLTAAIEKDVSGEGEPEAEITFALSVIKPARFETAVEKCTELGVRRIVPLVAKLCKPDISQRLKIERLCKIALEAAKQSGRSWVPEIISPIGLSDFLKRSNGSVFAASQKTDNSFEDVFRYGMDKRIITLVIGPEGDFTVEEYDLLSRYGAALFSLGELTLRSETAGIIATFCAVSALKKVL